MKVVVCPDSYKGTFTAHEIALWMKEAILAVSRTVEVIFLPLSDGGEGFLDAWNHDGKGQLIEISSTNADGKPIISKALLCRDRFAVLECATSCGLAHIGPEHDILRATSKGLGKDIRALVERGFKTIAIGLGGSATNDGGCGALAELGVRFINEKGDAFYPTGGDIGKVDIIDTTAAEELLKNVRLKLYTDVANPLCGQKGASRVFSSQKGATDNEIEILENNMRRFELRLKERGIASDRPGMGAAGGIPAGFSLLSGVEIFSGIDTILNGLEFEKFAKDAKIVITGEGRLDKQSFDGKVLSGLISRLAGQKIRIVSLSATVTPEGFELARHHHLECHSLFALAAPVQKDDKIIKKRLREHIATLLQ